LPEAFNTWEAIYDRTVATLLPDKMNYIFFDEIQLVKNFESLVDGLFVRPNVDLYITGSNALLLSGELATLLSGRYIAIEMYPFSFAEYLKTFESNPNLAERYADYVNYSSFPQAIDLYLSDKSLVDDYLKGIYDSVITKDIMTRGTIKQRGELERVIEYIFDSIGSEVSPTNIAKALSGNGGTIVHQTVDNYLDAFIKSYILYPVSRYDLKGRALLKTQKKYYVSDIGLSRAVLNRGFNTDRGHILENVIYLELRRKSGRISIGKTRDKEVDFVHVLPNGEISYYQVAYTAKEVFTLERELAPFKAIKDHNPKYLITTDWEETNIDGIKLTNAYKWLANEGQI
jgi:predicted AAA+ superfamily ATPase